MQATSANNDDDAGNDEDNFYGDDADDYGIEKNIIADTRNYQGKGRYFKQHTLHYQLSTKIFASCIG